MPELLEAVTLDETPPPITETEGAPDEVEATEGETKQPEGEPDAETGAPQSLFQPDGKKLEPAVLKALAEIKAAKPEIGKMLTKAVYRVAELDREFPGGLTEARELRDKVEEFGGVAGIEQKLETAAELDTLAKQFMAGDQAFVTDMVQSSPESFMALAPVVFDQFSRLNPEGFAGYIGRVVYGDMQRSEVPLLMMRLADVLGENPRAMEAFNQLNAYLAGFKTLAEKPVAAPKPKPGAADPKHEELSRREEALRASEWKIERETLQRSITDSEFTKALAGRKADTEAKAQIKELFLSRSKSAADRLFPGWAEKSARFIKAGDKPGYIRYMKSIYSRVIPDAMASAVASTLKGARAAAPPGARGGQFQKQNGVERPQNVQQAADGFKPVAAEPDTWDIDFTRTPASMISQNRAFLKDGKRVQWK